MRHLRATALILLYSFNSLLEMRETRDRHRGRAMSAEVSILYWRCVFLDLWKKLREMGGGFNSLLEMPTSWCNRTATTLPRLSFQFSIGDATYNVNGGMSQPMSASFNSLLEMRTEISATRRASRGSCVSILYWRCQAEGRRSAAVVRRAFQFSIGDAQSRQLL